MSDTVSWSIQLKVREGRLDDVRALMGEMVDATQAESGTIGYEWFVSADGGDCHLYERYSDSAAALVHLGNFGEHFAERFLDCLEPTGLTVYGEPSSDARAALDGFGAVYMGTLGGFHR